MEKTFKAQLYHRRRGRIGACISDGRVYFVINTESLESDFVDGTYVDIRLIDENQSTVEVVSGRILPASV